MALKPAASESEDSDGSDGVIAEINITPLVDVFLVLLIIFMVTSSVMSQMGMEVNLPGAATAASQQSNDGVIITLLPNGRLRVHSVEIPSGAYEQLEGVLKQAFAQTSSRQVILEGDRQAFLGNAVSVMDHAKRAGAQSFAIATSPEE